MPGISSVQEVCRPTRKLSCAVLRSSPLHFSSVQFTVSSVGTRCRYAANLLATHSRTGRRKPLCQKSARSVHLFRLETDRRTDRYQQTRATASTALAQRRAVNFRIRSTVRCSILLINYIIRLYYYINAAYFISKL